MIENKGRLNTINHFRGTAAVAAAPINYWPPVFTLENPAAPLRFAPPLQKIYRKSVSGAGGLGQKRELLERKRRRKKSKDVFVLLSH